MTAYGDAKQSIIFNFALEEFGRDYLADLIVLTGGVTKESALRYTYLMQAYYNGTPGNKRTGATYMPIFWDEIESMVSSPPEQNGFPLFRPIDQENFVGGEQWLNYVLEIEPDYQPAEFIGSSGTDLNQCFGTLQTFGYGTTGGLDRFTLLEGGIYQIFLGTSDTQFPRELLPEFGQNEVIDPD